MVRGDVADAAHDAQGFLSEASARVAVVLRDGAAVGDFHSLKEAGEHSESPSLGGFPNRGVEVFSGVAGDFVVLGEPFVVLGEVVAQGLGVSVCDGVARGQGLDDAGADGDFNFAQRVQGQGAEVFVKVAQGDDMPERGAGNKGGAFGMAGALQQKGMPVCPRAVRPHAAQEVHCGGRVGDLQAAGAEVFDDDDGVGGERHDG